MCLMALTRFHHFGSAISLPDASLAVFFFAGMGVSGIGFFMLLLVEAGLIDFLATTQYGVSDFCLTPAYVCLILAYVAIWFSGRYANLLNVLKLADAVKAFGLGIIGTIVAFIISNGSFYLFSGSFGVGSWANYFKQSSYYFPAYLSANLLYIAIGLTVMTLVKAYYKELAVEVISSAK